jgi:hypothetical protein
MEVHHHPDTEKKSLKGYLLEGFMIFIAVIMGFFAESIREKINENHIEKQYIKSLVNNLQQDKAALTFTIEDNRKKIKGLDSLLLLSSKKMDVQNKLLLYNCSENYITFYSRFSSNDVTMMQLKNSGGLQYIKHAHAADSIAKYDQVIRSIYAAEVPYSKAINDATDAMCELIIIPINSDTSFFKNGNFSNKDLPLINNDSQKLKIFFNKISLEKGWTQNYINNLQEILPYTIRLIEFLKKEYAMD